MNVISLLRTQAVRLETISERFRTGQLSAGITESFLVSDELDMIRGEILDAVVELELQAEAEQERKRKGEK